MALSILGYRTYVSEATVVTRNSIDPVNNSSGESVNSGLTTLKVKSNNKTNHLLSLTF